MQISFYSHIIILATSTQSDDLALLHADPKCKGPACCSYMHLPRSRDYPWMDAGHNQEITNNSDSSEHFIDQETIYLGSLS